MPVIKIETIVKAPIELVFDLTRRINLHEATILKHKEKAVAGVTKGMIKLGESVMWEAILQPIFHIRNYSKIS